MNTLVQRTSPARWGASPLLAGLALCFTFGSTRVASSQPADELVITPHKPGTPAGARPKAKAAPQGEAPGKAPKLVVLLVADQLRADTLTHYRAMLSPAGLLRLARGATAVGHYGQQNTYTGPGHALIATGGYGYLNGITQNKWFNR